MVAEWIRQAARHGAGSLLPNLDEQLAHFFEHGLSDQQRDHLMSLPGEDMQKQLRTLFERFQHGKKPPGTSPRPGKTGKADKPKAKDPGRP